mgnify:CR=1 FL=1
MSWPLPTTVTVLQQATGVLSRAAVTRIEHTLPWYAAMPADERASVGVVAQSGVRGFVDWLARGPQGNPSEITAAHDVFSVAPPTLTRVVSLRQTVELVRATISAVEDHAVALVPADEAPAVREAILRYSREIAFAAAEIYARAAEARGAWDARLEALVVDSVTRPDAPEQVVSRAAALGWTAPGPVTVVVGNAPPGASRSPIGGEALLARVRRQARAAGLGVLTGVQADRLVVVLGGLDEAGLDAMGAARAVVRVFAPGPVVVGPAVPELRHAARSAQPALAALRVAGAWAGTPRPVAADDLLPERALDGDRAAHQELIERVYRPLRVAGTPLLDTVIAYVEHGGSIEACARALIVHPNTVRYRLRRVGQLTGYWPPDPRDAFTLRVGLILGHLDGAEAAGRGDADGRGADGVDLPASVTG